MIQQVNGCIQFQLNFPWNKGNFEQFEIINIWDIWHSQLEMLLWFRKGTYVCYSQKKSGPRNPLFSCYANIYTESCPMFPRFMVTNMFLKNKLKVEKQL